jgi:hypothetical protein
MGMCTQAEADDVVARCRKAVEEYGGYSDTLETLRKYYQMLHDLPEHGALVMIEAELDRLEALYETT